ncbi:MAG: PLP-dependent aminotransferase family protein [Chloroflexi bacterium]|nr:PLP-dependent aminotransferase family protein [Chloroflexota bacterium]
MPKSAVSSNQTSIVLDHTSSVPLNRQLYDRLRIAILAGQLGAGTRLPSTRTLAGQLGVSRNTVCIAYEQLLAEGYVDSHVGYGTSVTRLVPEQLLTVQPAPHIPEATHDTAGHVRLSRRGELIAQTPAMPIPLIQAETNRSQLFRSGVPDPEAFPYEIWAQIVARQARRSLRMTSSYQDPAGYRPLREAIAAHIGVTRGVRCSADQIIVVAGSQGALDLAARVLLDPGDVACIEDPGYPGARGALQAAGAQLAPVPVNEEGLDVHTVRARYPHARLVSITPSHQFPLGVTMSLTQRLALLEWANQANAWILEDDYDSEYRFSGRPLEALQGLDHANHVIYIGTFSKVLFPALRLGYLVVPSDVVDAFVSARRLVDVHPPILEQLALTDFMVEGHFTRHLRRMRTLYAERRATLVEAIANEPGEILTVHAPEAGMHLMARLPIGINDYVVARQAAKQGVKVIPLSTFCIEPPQRGGLLLGYAASSVAEIQDGVHRLAQVIRSLIHTS